MDATFPLLLRFMVRGGVGLLDLLAAGGSTGGTVCGKMGIELEWASC